MNIQFNYFVIRYLSKRMGFDDKTSQIIACASQFIDDSNDNSNNAAVSFTTKEIENKKIERYKDLFENDGEKLKLYIPKTIHKDFSEYKDYNYYHYDNICWQALVPFHYPSLYPLDRDDDIGGESYQVEPPENFNSEGIFKNLTEYAINQYKGTEEQDTIEETAIRIGAISHMIAASYAHINLNGFVCDINDAEVNQVMDGDLTSYITDRYILSATEEKAIPFIGQYRIKNVLDECYVRVNFTQIGFPIPQHTIVDTLQLSMEAAKCIYRFFLKLLDLTDYKFSVWKGTYEPVVRSMLSFRNTNIDELTKKWSEKCPDIKFSYNKNDVIKTLKDKSKADYLFGAAIVADDIRRAVITPEEKTMFAGNGKTKGSISFSSIKFEADEFVMTAIATTEDTDIPRKLTMGLYNDRGQLLISKEFKLEENGNSITGEIRNNIPKHKYGYRLKAALYTDNNPDIVAAKNDMKVTFEDSSSLITCTKNSLAKEDVDEVEVVYNMEGENNSNFSYFDNADYFNQANNHVIDILLPLMAEFRINENYTFTSVTPTLMFTDRNNNFIHCGNTKFNNITFNEDGSLCNIQLNKEWKNHIPLDIYHGEELTLTLKITLDVTVTPKEGSGFVGERTFIWEPIHDIFPQIKMKWKEDAKKR